jgi:hypothetical protein
MFNYMTDVEYVDVDPMCHRELTVTGQAVFLTGCIMVAASPCVSFVVGHDMLSLLFNTLDECLFLFCSEGIVVKDVMITESKWDEFRLVLAWCGMLLCVLTPPTSSKIVCQI